MARLYNGAARLINLNQYYLNLGGNSAGGGESAPGGSGGEPPGGRGSGLGSVPDGVVPGEGEGEGEGDVPASAVESPPGGGGGSNVGNPLAVSPGGDKGVISTGSGGGGWMVSMVTERLFCSPASLVTCNVIVSVLGSGLRG